MIVGFGFQQTDFNGSNVLNDSTGCEDETASQQVYSTDTGRAEYSDLLRTVRFKLSEAPVKNSLYYRQMAFYDYERAIWICDLSSTTVPLKYLPLWLDEYQDRGVSMVEVIAEEGRLQHRSSSNYAVVRSYLAQQLARGSIVSYKAFERQNQRGVSIQFVANRFRPSDENSEVNHEIDQLSSLVLHAVSLQAPILNSIIQNDALMFDKSGKPKFLNLNHIYSKEYVDICRAMAFFLSLAVQANCPSVEILPVTIADATDRRIMDKFLKSLITQKRIAGYEVKAGVIKIYFAP